MFVSQLTFFLSAFAARSSCVPLGFGGTRYDDSQVVVLEDLLPVCSCGCCVLGLFQGEMRKEASTHGFYFWVTSSVFLPTEWIYSFKVKDKMHINYMTVCATSVKTEGSYGSVVPLPFLSFTCLYDKAREEFLDWNRWDRLWLASLLPEKQPIWEKWFTVCYKSRHFFHQSNQKKVSITDPCHFHIPIYSASCLSISFNTLIIKYCRIYSIDEIHQIIKNNNYKK